MAWSIERGRRKREDERRFDKEVRQLCVELALAVRDVHMPEDHMGPSPLATDHEKAWRLTATLLEMELIAPKDLHEAAANAYLSPQQLAREPRGERTPFIKTLSRTTLSWRNISSAARTGQANPR